MEHVDAILDPTGGVRGIYGNDGAGPMAKIVGFGEAAPTGGDFSTIFFVSRDQDNLAFQASVFTIRWPSDLWKLSGSIWNILE